jgi:hypothetical protein
MDSEHDDSARGWRLMRQPLRSGALILLVISLMTAGGVTRGLAHELAPGDAHDGCKVLKIDEAHGTVTFTTNQPNTRVKVTFETGGGQALSATGTTDEQGRIAADGGLPLINRHTVKCEVVP